MDLLQDNFLTYYLSSQNGDVINFWTFVVYNGLGYHQDDGVFTIQIAAEPNSTTSANTNTILHPVTTDTPVACTKSATRVNNVLDAPCAGELLFEDNFDTLNDSNWQIEQRFSTQPDNEFGIYLNRPDIVQVSAGRLSVGAIRLRDYFEAANSLQIGEK